MYFPCYFKTFLNSGVRTPVRYLTLQNDTDKYPIEFTTQSDIEYLFSMQQSPPKYRDTH